MTRAHEGKGEGRGREDRLGWVGLGGGGGVVYEIFAPGVRVRTSKSSRRHGQAGHSGRAQN